MKLLVTFSAFYNMDVVNFDIYVKGGVYHRKFRTTARHFSAELRLSSSLVENQSLPMWVILADHMRAHAHTYTHTHTHTKHIRAEPKAASEASRLSMPRVNFSLSSVRRYPLSMIISTYSNDENNFIRKSASRESLEFLYIWTRTPFSSAKM